MIIFRYLAKEIFSTFLVISGMLLLLFLSTQFARYLPLAAAGKLLGLQFIHLIILAIPQLLSLIFPLSLYLSLLLVYGRLYAESEMTVLYACGLSYTQLLKMTFIFSMAVAIPVMLFTLWINPNVAYARNQLLAQISATSMLQTLLPGRFQQAEQGNKIFYIESMSNDRQSLKHIFAAERTDNHHWTVMKAEKGQYYIDPTTHDRFVVTNNGYRYEGIAGKKDFTITHFDQYGVRLNIPVTYSDYSEIDSIPTLKLWYPSPSQTATYSAELQWRLAFPICTFILALLAFSLSRVAPRTGRFARFFPAILLYILYANSIVVGQDWIIEGEISPAPGLWILHAVMLFIGIGLTMHQQNRFQRLKRWLP